MTFAHRRAVDRVRSVQARTQRDTRATLICGMTGVELSVTTWPTGNRAWQACPFRSNYEYPGTTLARAFVGLADTLVDDFGVLGFLRVLAEQSVDLLNVSARGIIVIDERGGLRVVATSSDEPSCWNCSRYRPLTRTTAATPTSRSPNR